MDRFTITFGACQIFTCKYIKTVSGCLRDCRLRSLGNLFKRVTTSLSGDNDNDSDNYARTRMQAKATRHKCKHKQEIGVTASIIGDLDTLFLFGINKILFNGSEIFTYCSINLSRGFPVKFAVL